MSENAGSAKSRFIRKYGDYALVTGASSGIGEEFANQLAKKGLNLILTARRKSKLDELADKLTNAYAIKVKTVELDLLSSDAMVLLARQTMDEKVGLLVLSAGMEVHGDFVKEQL